MINVTNLQHKHGHANPYIMNDTPNTQQTTPSDYNIEKESIVNATNELLKWYHGCTGHFTAKAKEIIESSDNPDIIENVFADFLNDEATGICTRLGFQPFGMDEPANNNPQNHDADYDLDDENNDDDIIDDNDEDMITISRKRMLQLEYVLENARNTADFYKAGLEAEMEGFSSMMVDYRHLEAKYEDLKNKLNELRYGNQEFGE